MGRSLGMCKEFGVRQQTGSLAYQASRWFRSTWMLLYGGSVDTTAGIKATKSALASRVASVSPTIKREEYGASRRTRIKQRLNDAAPAAFLNLRFLHRSSRSNRRV